MTALFTDRPAHRRGREWNAPSGASVVAPNSRRGLALLFVLLGGAGAASLGLLTWVVIITALGDAPSSPWYVLVLVVAVLALAAPLGLLTAVRRIERVLAQTLLGVWFPDDWEPEPSPTLLERGRMVVAFTGHVAAGIVLIISLIVGLPASLSLVSTPMFLRAGEHPFDLSWTPAAGSGLAWLNPVAGVLLLVGTVVVVFVVLPWACRLGVELLVGPTAAERVRLVEQETVRLAERNRIARDLHDSVGHDLSLIAVLAAAAKRTTGDPQAQNGQLDAVESSARSALENLDKGLRVLREGGPADRWQDTLTDLEPLLTRLRQAGLEIEAHQDGDVEAVSELVSREGYRIVAEGLANALRHGTGRRATLTVTVTDRSVSITVANPVGHRPRTRSGRGLLGIHERATILGGAARGERVGDVWQLTARLPLKTDRNATTL